MAVSIRYSASVSKHPSRRAALTLPVSCPQRGEPGKEAVNTWNLVGCCLVASAGGEPGVRPDWRDLIEAYAARGYLPVLYTHGECATAAQAPARCAVGLVHVHIAIDSPDRDRHDAKRGLPACWHQRGSGPRGRRLGSALPSDPPGAALGRDGGLEQ